MTLRSLTRLCRRREPEPTTHPCWFCKRPVSWDYLIAGYDTWDESRLACLDCDRRMKLADRDHDQPSRDTYPDSLLEERP